MTEIDYVSFHQTLVEVDDGLWVNPQHVVAAREFQEDFGRPPSSTTIGMVGGHVYSINRPLAEVVAIINGGG